MWRHVFPGDTVRFQAPLENATRDAANTEHMRQTSEVNERPDRRREHTVARIRNLTGLDLERGDVVALTDMVITPDDDLDAWFHRPLFDGELPPETGLRGKLGVLLEPCAAATEDQVFVASVVVSGWAHAKLQLENAAHTHAALEYDSEHLQSTSDTGAPCEILWREEPEEVPAEVWAVVRVSNWHRVEALRGACLAENHPGRGLEFEIHLGEWDPDDHRWVYDTENAAVAIDWRYGVPYPDAGTQGLFAPHDSTEHGTIWEVVDLDCESPGECGD